MGICVYGAYNVFIRLCMYNHTVIASASRGFLTKDCRLSKHRRLALFSRPAVCLSVWTVKCDIELCVRVHFLNFFFLAFISHRISVALIPTITPFLLQFLREICLTRINLIQRDRNISETEHRSHRYQCEP